MESFASFARADWGPALRAAADRVAYAVAILIVAAELTYRAGLATGRAVHWLSDRLAGLASGRIDRAQTARAVVAWARAVLTPEPAPAPAPEPSIAETFAAVAAATAAADAEPVPTARRGYAFNPAVNYERVITAWLAVDAGSEHVISEHETEEQAAVACRSYRQSHPGRCPRTQARVEYRLAPTASAVTMACTAAPVASPSVAVAPPALDTLKVADLRRLARARGLSDLARKGRRADLLAALTD